MTFATVHKATTYAMVASAMLGLIGGGTVSPLFTLLGVVGLLASWFWEPPRVNVDRWAPWWTVLSVLVMVYALITGLATGDYLGVGAEFLIWLVLAKAFTRRTLRDWQQLHLLSLLIFLSSAIFFLAMPRIGSGFFMKGRTGLSMAGFSDGVQLGGHGVIKDDATIVMRVRLPNGYDGARAAPIHWRGVAFDSYHQGRSQPAVSKKTAPSSCSRGWNGLTRTFRLLSHCSAGWTIP